MRKIIIVPILIMCVMLSGCVYNGFTFLRIKATQFSANCGPLNHFSGENVDAIFTRDTSIAKEFAKNPHDINMGLGENASILITGDYTS